MTCRESFLIQHVVIMTHIIPWPSMVFYPIRIRMCPNLFMVRPSQGHVLLIRLSYLMISTCIGKQIDTRIRDTALRCSLRGRRQWLGKMDQGVRDQKAHDRDLTKDLTSKEAWGQEAWGHLSILLLLLLLRCLSLWLRGLELRMSTKSSWWVKSQNYEQEKQRWRTD